MPNPLCASHILSKFVWLFTTVYSKDWKVISKTLYWFRVEVWEHVKQIVTFFTSTI